MHFKILVLGLAFLLLLTGCEAEPADPQPPGEEIELNNEEELPPEEETRYSIDWDEEVAITTTGAPSIFPTLGISGSTLHLAWVDMRHGMEIREIYYLSSEDNGLAWTEEMRLTNDPNQSIRPSIATTNDNIIVFWRDDRHNNFELYCRRSPDLGTSWNEEIRLTENPGYSGCPFPAVAGDKINIFWRDDREGTFKVYQMQSQDAGESWGEDILIAQENVNAEFPFAAAYGETVHLVWRDNRDGNAEVYYNRSLDGGNSWEGEVRLTDDPGESEHPKLAVSGSTVHLFWRDNRQGKNDIFYMKSDDAGETWSDKKALIDQPGHSFWPVPAVKDDLVHLIWAGVEGGSTGIYHIFSQDNGETWSDIERLSDCMLPFNAGVMAAYPIALDDDFVHVVFNDDRSGINEIYYIRGTVTRQ